MKDTYWNGKGVEQSKYNELKEAGWLENVTKASAEDMHRYYRYYNDGDLPGWARGKYKLTQWSNTYGHFTLNSAGEQELEDRATQVILREYERFQKANKKKNT